MSTTLAQRWQQTCDDVARIASACGRDARDVSIVAVSKTVGVYVIGEALDCGIVNFGENREKPFAEKTERYPQAKWHFIGHLQSNKAKQVVGKADLIHSLDRPSLLEAIEKAAGKLDIVQDVLIEVSISGEESKAGLPPCELDGFLELVSACKHVRCLGLMTMAPRGDLTIARKTFEGLRKLASNTSEKWGRHGSISLSELSMGMSEDYEAAIQEGATMVRIGRRIFNEDFTAL